jgi:predicted TIM-barrel fold metal-dependent hydrolase
VGETERVAAIATASEAAPGATIAGIVGHADLTLPVDQLDEVLDAHEAAGGGRFRGIRDALASAPPGEPLLIPGGAAPAKAAAPDFRRGVEHLGARGLTYDTWQYHTQLRDLIDLARAVPGTTIVLDHFSTPLGVGSFAGRHDEIFAAWKDELAELARCENVVAKLGGLAMPDNGFWAIGGDRPDVEAFLAAQDRWYHHAIECFGPSRCMFESNFPVDKMSVDYQVVWAAFEQIAARYDSDEQDDLLAGTARRVYRLPTS